MAKNKKKVLINKSKNNSISSIITKCEKKSRILKFNNYKKQYDKIDYAIKNYIDDLLESIVFDLENKCFEIQNVEFEIASDILIKQYDNELNLLGELEKVIDGKSNIDNCVKIASNFLEEKKKAINFFSMKTYNSKPKKFIQKVVNALVKSDTIIKNIAKNVPSIYFDKVYIGFIEALEVYHTQFIQTKINESSLAFSEEVESLNRIVEKSEFLIKQLEKNITNKEEIKHEVEINIKKISNNKRLKSTYKVLHSFALNLGFKPIRQRGTSHLIYKNESKSVVIPNKKGDISIGLLSSIIKQLGSNRNEFLVFNDNSIEKEFNQKKVKKDLKANEESEFIYKEDKLKFKPAEIVARNLMNFILNFGFKVESFYEVFKARFNYEKSLDLYSLTEVVKDENGQEYTLMILGELNQESQKYYPSTISVYNNKEFKEKNLKFEDVNDSYLLNVGVLICTIIDMDNEYNKAYTSLLNNKLIGRKEILKYRYINDCIGVSFVNKNITIDLIKYACEKGINIPKKLNENEVLISEKNRVITLILIQKDKEMYKKQVIYQGDLRDSFNILERNIIEYLLK